MASLSPPDLWTFSIIVPSSDESPITTSSTSNDHDSDGDVELPRRKTRVVQLQRALDDDDPRKAATSIPVRQSQVQNLQEATLPTSAFYTTTATATATDERTSLLKDTISFPEKSSSATSPSTTSSGRVVPLNPTGWTFSSPFWTLQSSILLKMVYKPAWQVLPDFTNHQCSQQDTTKQNAWFLGTTASTATAAACCCCCGCCTCSGPSPHHSITFTTADIESMESLANVNIRGVGDCSGIRLHLKYPQDCFRLVVPTNVPQQFQSNWNEQVQHAQHNQNQYNNNNSNGDTNFLHKMQQEIHADLEAGDSLPVTCHTRGPTITFCMPKDTAHGHDEEPPLVWKVELPTPEGGPIALESLTIMDGPLLTQSPSGWTSQQPTHVYINGYQCWSFAGSIPLGQPQPQSAMPDVFSRAFNYGASLPPPSLEFIPLPATNVDGTSHNNHRFPVYNRPTPESPYRSDFFTCITSHEEEQYDDDVDADADADANAGDMEDIDAIDNNNNNHLNTGDDDDDPTESRLRGRLARRRRRRRRPKVVHQALDERGGPALVLGWLSQRRQFGMIAVDKELQRIQMHCSLQGQLLLPAQGNDDSGDGAGILQTDWAFCQLEAPHTYDEEPLVHFLRAVAGYNQAKPLQNGPLLTGWCSWYHYYENISEDSLRTNFTKLSNLRKICPTNVSVVDDGYMTAWGDWNSLKPNKFSTRDSMKSVADSIREEKMRPGIWLAPFACDKHSKLVQEHPDWIIRNHQGIPANSSNCGKFFYGLDATNPQVLEYVYKCIRRAVHEWGYSVLKIDFLYAACLDGNGKYDLSLSRAQAMHLALHTIRSAAGPNTFLIGCGCPLGSGIGYVDGMRISADTGPTWYPSFPLPWWDHATLPSLRGMIRNSITRAPLGHRWWHNDPDCLMLGSTTHLTLEEVASSASIVALTCGMLLLSDDLTKVSPARMRILTKIFPMTGVSAVVLDLHSLSDGHGLPTMLRLWCTDVTQKREEFQRVRSQSATLSEDERDHNEEAGFFSRFASFQLGSPPTHPSERLRSCIHMVKGLGTWTVLSLSNWLDNSAVVHVPPLALAPPPEAATATSFRRPVNTKHGYHVFAFWSSKYSWIPETPEYPDSSNAEEIQNGSATSFSERTPFSDRPLLSKLLGPHETEIFHIKPVMPEQPQYLGSDIHFSCGQEVGLFHAEKSRLTIQLRTDYHRVGHIFVFVPIVNTGHVKTFCAGEPCRWTVIGSTRQDADRGGPSSVLGRVLQIAVASHADGREQDGKVVVEY